MLFGQHQRSDRKPDDLRRTQRLRGAGFQRSGAKTDHIAGECEIDDLAASTLKHPIVGDCSTPHWREVFD